MHGINSINQQVISVHYQLFPQGAIVIRSLPDYPCIEFALRMHEIRNWQRAVKKLLESIVKYNQATIEEIQLAIVENPELFQSNGRKVIKYYQAELGVTFNKYSLLSINKKTKQQRILLQNRDENKKSRLRPNDRAKADGSLCKLSGFADEQTFFAITWRDGLNEGKLPTLRQIIDGLVSWIVIQTEYRMRNVKS